jgi:hypothetical protein
MPEKVPARSSRLSHGASDFDGPLAFNAVFDRPGIG